MKIAIHHNPGSFSDRWINYCKENSIEYKIVNCYVSDIIFQLSDCQALMWHFSHVDYKDALFAKQLLTSLECSGKKIFPDFNTRWHFDDKVGQKYLLESIRAPLVPSYVFYTSNEAKKYIKSAVFPKVFKLRRGAGSSNVKLVHNKQKALHLVNQAFSKGFSQFDRLGYLKERIRKVVSGQDSMIGILKGIGRLFLPTKFSRMYQREKGYIYFQDFIQGNLFDIRVIVIGDHAFAIKRLVRKNDFRASGSGSIIYRREEINEECLKIAFKVNETLNAQCVGFDFVFNEKKEPVIIEISYGFTVHGYDSCPGYWTSDLGWHQGKFVPQNWMIENLILSIRK
jgi:glutathione synthase/RimK-type ligase-like ATP-grasp enzyme